MRILQRLKGKQYNWSVLAIVNKNSVETSNHSLKKSRKIYSLLEDSPKEIIKELTLERVLANEHSISSLLEMGVLNLNKPMGPTSHQVSSWVKNMFKAEKVGHGGTLDPRVTGVLPMAFGSGARILSVLTFSTKEYVGVMRLHQDLPKKKVKRVFDEFVGDIYQFPPLRSAVKRQLRIRRIYSLEQLEQNGRDVLFRVECAPGTYIRSLIHDMGLVLGSGAHMQELRRTKTGVFHEREAVTLQELKDALVFWKDDNDDTALRKCVWPLETLTLDLPKMIIQDSAVDAVCHGAPLAVPGVVQFEEILHPGELVAIFTNKLECVAIGKSQMPTSKILDSKSGIVAKTWRVIMPPGTYKKGWKSKE